ncbi:MAG: hypothetical protein WAT16_11290 [Saprospiraceae bacterium]
MKGKILDKIKEKDSTCYLVKIQLKEFVTSLPEGYKDYEVQREIVNNTYLDTLIDTVLEKKHIPPIVLVADADKFQEASNELQIEEFKILDGLQRTYRLKLIWDSIEFFQTEMLKSHEILELKRIQLSKKYSSTLDNINSNSKILESIISFHKTNPKIDIKSCFDSFQWFEVWTNLTPQEEVRKMLVLNAGHKPVKTQHQLELLFLNLIPIIKKSELKEFELIREKKSNSTVFSKNRVKGQFHFSHLITSILSFHEGKPITANVNLVHKAQSSDFDIDEFDRFFNYDFLHKFIESLLKFDTALETTYNGQGTKWLGREISLVGTFAALGKYMKENELSPLKTIEKFNSEIIENPSILNLTEFENARNNLDLSKINIGTVNKNAVYNGIYALLKGTENSITWTNYFKGLVK